MHIRQLTSDDLAQLRDQLRELAVLNWQETGYLREFNPNFEQIGSLVDIGVMTALGAIDRDGKLIGYSAFIVAPHTHNRDVIVGANDALFVHPEHRAGTLGGRMILETELEAKRLGASVFLWHCRWGSDLVNILRRHGYSDVDTVIGKEL